MNDEKAVEQLEEFLVIDDWSAVYMPYLQDAIEYVINRIKTDRWIPVTERLPEEHKKVFVSDIFGVYIGEFIDDEENWGGKHFINEHGMHSKSVTHWKPLPKAPESEDKE